MIRIQNYSNLSCIRFDTRQICKPLERGLSRRFRCTFVKTAKKFDKEPFLSLKLLLEYGEEM